MNNKRLIRLLITCILPGVLASPAAHALNLVDTLDRAEKYDALLQAAYADYIVVQETSDISDSALLPQVSFNAYYNTNKAEVNDVDNDFDIDELSLNLDQVIFNKEVWDTSDQSDALVLQAAAEYEAAKQQLIIRAASAYFNVLGAEDNLEFARAEKDSAERQLEQSKERFNVGLIAITDVHEAQATYDSSVAQEIIAVNLLYDNKEALRVIIGNPLGDLKPLVEEFPLKSPKEDIDKWQQRALAENLDLRAAMSGLEAAKHGYDSSHAGHYPTLNLNVNYSDQNADGSLLVSGERDTQDLSATLSLNVPIYEGGGTSAAARKSMAEVERAQALLDQQRRKTILEIRTAYLGVESAISSVKAFKQALISSRTALEATQAGFDAGTRTSVDVLIVEGRLYDSERDYARARYDYLLSVLELKRAAGSLTAKDIYDINQWLTK